MPGAEPPPPPRGILANDEKAVPVTSSPEPPQPILIVLPTYNEAQNVPTLIPDILDRVGGWDARVLVIDDASADGTADLVRALGRDNPRVLLLERPGKLGLGTAYLAGFRQGLAQGYGLIVTMDADYSHSPDHLPALIAASTDAAVVIGSRYTPGGGVSNWPVHRRWLSWSANALAHALVGIKSHDCTSGFRAYRREALESVDLDSIRSDGYSFLMEMLAACERGGATIAETPIQFVDRRGGESKISRAEIFKALGALWRMVRKYRLPGGR